MAAWSLFDVVLTLLLLLGAGVALAGGLVVVLGLLKGMHMLVASALFDLWELRHVRQALTEWKQRHPLKAARYKHRGRILRSDDEP